MLFDHWKRVQRLPYLEQTFGRLARAAGTRTPFALWGRERVVFFVLPQKEQADALADAGRDLARRWHPLLTFTAASDFEEAAS